ncbi:MAG: TonB-dependent receptor [Hyphomonadaceae bacterium]|nr:TonB-dependent receptor [Hyphomonadaceae bacterium]
MRWTPLIFIALASPAAAQDIVVTGERRPQSIQTLAGNTATLGGAELERIDPQVASEALNRLPGVAIHRNNGVENLPAIRSPVLNGGQSAGSFLVLEDGVPIRAPGFGNVNQLYETSLDFADGVEVVRGPGSALYGSNAVHGIVNVITTAPGVGDGDAGRLQLSAGSFGRVQAAGSRAFGTREGAVDDSNLGFVGIALAHEDGWRADSGVDQQHVLAGWDAYLGAWNLESRFVFQNVNQETAGFIQGANAYDDGALARSNPTPNAFRDQQLARAHATLSRPLGPGELRVTPYARWIDAELLLSFFPSQALESTGQSGGGVQTAYYWDAASNLSLIVGADADVTRGRLREVQTLADQPNGYVQGLHYDYRVDMQALAAFAQARWRFAPDWTLTAGLRGERVSYEYDNRAPDGDFGRFRRAADRSDAFEALTPKLGVTWQVRPSQTLYLNLARGARPPQITDLYSLQTLQTPGEQEVETIDSIESGWRGAVGPAQFELSLYHMDKNDTSFRNADGFTITNGRTRHEGVELSGEAPVGEAFTFSGWVSYARHTYRFNDPVARAGESISSGDDVDSAPRWIWNARAAWRPIEPASLELEWAHMGEYFTNAENTARYDGHDLLNLRAEYDVNGRLTVFAAVRNLTNTDYAERADFAFGNDRYFPGEDRGVTIGFRARP